MEVIIRFTGDKQHSSMSNYLENCMIPLANKLTKDGIDVIFYSNQKIKNFKHKKSYLNRRRGILNLLGMVVDDIDLLLYTTIVGKLRNKKTLVICINQLQPMFLSRKNFIQVIHDLIPLEYPTFWSKLHYFYKYLLPISLKHAYKLISVSSTTKRKIIDHYSIDENKIDVILNGIKFHGKFESKESPIENQYIYIGADMPHKNIDILIDVIETSKTDSLFVFIGKCCNMKRLIDISERKENVVLLGIVDETTLQQEIKKSKALIFPSITEGFGLPLIEAMYYKKNIIVADADYSQEVCLNFPVIFFNPNSKESLQDKIDNFHKYDRSDEIVNFDIVNDIINKYDWNLAVDHWLYIVQSYFNKN